MLLQFGASSSHKLFSNCATAARHFMHYNGGTYVEYYFDDYITIGAASSTVCRNNLETMTRRCKDLGFSLNVDKICPPSRVMEYLGIILDTDLMQTCIYQECLQDIPTKCQLWCTLRMATKWKILLLWENYSLFLE